MSSSYHRAFLVGFDDVEGRAASMGLKEFSLALLSLHFSRTVFPTSIGFSLFVQLISSCRRVPCSLPSYLQHPSHLIHHRSLKWSLHPPTPFTVLKHVILLLPFAVVPAEARHDILELSRFLTELSVIDYFFVPHRSSDIGMAAMLNAMEAIPYVTDVMVATFVQELHTTVGIDVTRPEIQQCRTRLRLLYLQGGYARPDEASAEVRCASISPVCVSYGVNVAHQQHPESAKAAPVTQTCSVLSESALVS